MVCKGQHKGSAGEIIIISIKYKIPLKKPLNNTDRKNVPIWQYYHE
jgi:hypothetical protein